MVLQPGHQIFQMPGFLLRVAEMTQQTAVFTFSPGNQTICRQKELFAFSLQTALWTEWRDGGSEPAFSHCDICIFQDPAEKAGSQPTRPVFSAVCTNEGTVEPAHTFPAFGGGEISQGPFPVFTQNEKIKHHKTQKRNLVCSNFYFKNRP